MDYQDDNTNKRQKTGASSNSTKPPYHNMYAHTDIDDLQTLKSKFDQLQEITTNYPDITIIHSAVHKQNPNITEADIQSFSQRHLQHLRIYKPLLPQALNAQITDIYDHGVLHSSTTRRIQVQLLQVLALAWAAVKAISLQQRKELLDNDLSKISSKVHLLNLPVSVVPKVKNSLQQIYFVHFSATDSAITAIHQEVLQLLPAEVHSRASHSVIVTGDDAAQFIPTFLAEQLQAITLQQDAALIVPSNDSNSPWSTPQSRLQDFPKLPSASQSGDIWKLATIPTPRPPPANRSMSINLPSPIIATPITDERIAAITETAFSCRSDLIFSRDTIPEEFSQVQQSVDFDEHIMLTRYLWVVGLAPCHTLATEHLNREYTIAEQKHVVECWVLYQSTTYNLLRTTMVSLWISLSVRRTMHICMMVVAMLCSSNSRSQRTSGRCKIHRPVTFFLWSKEF